MESTQNYLEILDEGMADTGEFRFCCCMNMTRA